MSPNAPLTDEQRNAVMEVRDMLSSTPPSSRLGAARSVDERARHPNPGSLPAVVTVHIEIAPPSVEPHPLLDSGMLKAPERVPVYFYALRSSCADADLASTRVIFFIHGGGNVTGHPTDPPFVQFHSALLRAVAAATNTTKWVLVAPSYRLATVPENVFPAALQDLVAAYDYVLAKGYDTTNVFIAGDSAGGNHAIVLTHLVLHVNRIPPRGVFVLAPAAIQVFDCMSAHANVQVGKDILDVPRYEAMARAYVGDSGMSPADPLVSGAFVPLTASWPRTLILVGTADIIIDAARELQRRLVALGRPVELVKYDERPHLWWIMPHIFPENVRDAVERIAQFVLH